MPKRKNTVAEAQDSTNTIQTQRGGNGRRGRRGINKMECVRQALADLGKDATPKQIGKFLKSRYKVEMNPKMISTYKGSILRKEARQSGLMSSPAAWAPAPVRRPSGADETVEEVRAVKNLGDRLGPDKVRALLDVLYQ
jgi:hypothetical protein